MTRYVSAKAIAGIGVGLLVVLGLLVAVPGPDAAALGLLGVLYLALGLLAHLLVTEPKEVQFLQWMLLLTMLLRFAFSIVQHYAWPGLGYMLQVDAFTSLRVGRELAEEWHLGLSRPALPATVRDVHGWFHFYRSAFLFYHFGYSPLLPEATNIAMSASCALAGYLIVRRWAPSLAARIGALLIGFWPSLMVWSSHNLKDPVNMAALCWSTYGILRLRDRPSAGWVGVVIIMWVVSFLTRPYMAVMMVAGQLATIALVAVRTRTALGRLASILLVVGLGGVSVSVGSRQIREMYGEGGTLKYAEEKRRVFQDAVEEDWVQHGRRHSEYIITLRATSTASALLQLPLRIPLFLLSPVPVRLGSIPMMATYPEMLFLYWLIPRFIVGLRRLWRTHRNEGIFVLSSIMPICIAFSIGSAVSGEAMRYRDILLPSLLAFAAVGWGLQLAARAKQRRPASVHAASYRRASGDALPAASPKGADNDG